MWIIDRKEEYELIWSTGLRKVDSVGPIFRTDGLVQKLSHVIYLRFPILDQ